MPSILVQLDEPLLRSLNKVAPAAKRQRAEFPCTSPALHSQRFVSRSCVIPLDRLSGLRQLVEEVVHGEEDLGFVGIEDVVIGVGQTDHLS